MVDKNTIPSSQTLAKAIQILENFTPDNPEWGIRELGRDLDINPTTVYRLVSTLRSSGYLEQNAQTQRYTLGPKVVKLARLYTHLNPLPIVAHKIFEQYSNRFEYNFYLGRLSHYEVIFLAVLDGRGPIQVVVETGGSTTLHSTALGKVLMAFQDDAFVDEFIANTELSALTPRSITDPVQLRAQIEEIRVQKYAVNNGEHYDDVGAIGVPVFEQSGRVQLGVSLAYPRHLIQKDHIEIDRLIDLAQEIAEEIGARAGLSYYASR